MYEIYYKTTAGLKWVGRTARVETASYCVFALNRQGWETEVFYA